MQIDHVINKHADCNLLHSTAGLAKWDPADPASPGMAAADWSGHPHISAACDCDS